MLVPQADELAVELERLRGLRLAPPRDRGARVLAVGAREPELVAREHDGYARQAHREPERDRHGALRRVGAESRRVVRVESVHRREAHAPGKLSRVALHLLPRLPRGVARDAADRLAEEPRLLVPLTLGVLPGRTVGCTEPAPHGTREVRVGHRPVPRIALEVARRVVGRLGEQDRIGLDLGHRAPDRLPHLGVEVHSREAAGHVGHVDAPAVERVRRPQPPPDDRIRSLDEAAAELRRAPVELGKRRRTEPRLVLGVRGVAEVVERALRGIRMPVGRPEPLVAVARVVAREVADHPDAARVRRLDEPHERLVAPEQRIDLGEARGVVAVVRRAGEYGRQIEQRDAELDEVVEVLHDPVEVAAVELLGAPRQHGVDGIVPGCRDGPVGRGSLVCGRRAREAVGEHLVHDRLGEPRGRRIAGDECEVLGVEQLRAAEARLAEPLDPAVLAHEQPAVAVPGVRDDDRGLPPLPARGIRPESHRVVPAGLVVGVRPHAHGVQGGVARGHAQPHPDGVAECRILRRDVQRRTVVVRCETRHGCRAAAHLTAPAVRPPTMYRCRKRKSTMTGTAASTAPAEKRVQFFDVSCETNW